MDTMRFLFTHNGFSVKVLFPRNRVRATTLPARVDKESFLGRGTKGRQLGLALARFRYLLRVRRERVLGRLGILAAVALAGAAQGEGGRAGGILSIPAEEVSLGSLRVGTIHVQAPTPHTPPLQSFLVDFSQQTTRFSHLFAKVCFQSSPRALGCCIDGPCGTGDYTLPDLPREASRSRSTPEKSKSFGPDGAPFPSKTSITQGSPVVAVAVSLDPILPQR